MKRKLNSGFTQFNTVYLVTKARHIVTTLDSGNGATYFNQPYPADVPSLADIGTATDALATANELEDSVSATQTRKALRVPVQDKLRNLADYLELVAAGDLLKLAATGYDLAKDPVHTHQPPGAPQDVIARATGINGGIDVRCAAEPLADFYELEVSTVSAAGPWTAAGSFTSTRSIHAEGFAHGQDVYAHVRAVGIAGESPWSDPAVVLVN